MAVGFTAKRAKAGNEAGVHGAFGMICKMESTPIADKRAISQK